MVARQSHASHSGLSAHGVAHVRLFNEARKLSLAKDDANGHLLNDAVTVHINEESHGDADNTE